MTKHQDVLPETYGRPPAAGGRFRPLLTGGLQFVSQFISVASLVGVVSCLGAALAYGLAVMLVPALIDVSFSVLTIQAFRWRRPLRF